MQTTDARHEAPLLEGLTVLDLSQGIAGPCCAMQLRQQGARVIKVEPPEGDWARHMGRARAGQCAISLAYNAGKESAVIDTRTPAGRTALRKLAREADIVVQSFRPGVVERLGVDYASLAQDRPDLIYVSISGWGGTGPAAGLPAVDTVVQAETGLMDLNRDASGRPHKVGLFVVDIVTGMHAAQGVFMALLRRALRGGGRHIEVSMLQAAAAMQAYPVLDAHLHPEGAAAVNAPGGLFETRDGAHLYTSVANDGMFRRMAEALGETQWLADAGLAHSAGRIARARELNARVAERLRGEDAAYWEQRLAEHDVLRGRVRTVRDLPQHPQARHAGVFVYAEQPGLGALPWPVPPGHEGGGACAPAPALGQHTEAVWAEFGLASG
ncbi:CoA transferase [Verticiella sediminum]|uniref:CoA transferase n=1 Tax=Verticiella sediminum TaxID=1247510 RepID=A0A556AVD6_9BURK|nr:CoA transferase [Verticiella sediminum]TSH96901.1 CoA transferase [Verticiella sediminum]